MKRKRYRGTENGTSDPPTPALDALIGDEEQKKTKGRNREQASNPATLDHSVHPTTRLDHAVTEEQRRKVWRQRMKHLSPIPAVDALIGDEEQSRK